MTLLWHSTCALNIVNYRDTVSVDGGAAVAIGSRLGLTPPPSLPRFRRGVNVKTRKRNIVVPSDPGSFADAVITIFQDAFVEGATVEQNLEAGAKELDNAELDFSRYGETLFETLIAGGRLATGGNLAEDSGNKLATHVRCSAS